MLAPGEIYDLTKGWIYSRIQETTKADTIRKKNMEIKKEMKTPHLGAIYTSRLLTNITKGKKLVIYKAIT